MAKSLDRGLVDLGTVIRTEIVSLKHVRDTYEKAISQTQFDTSQ